MESAVVLLSGGLDSATALALAQNEGYTCHAMSFAYDQRHAVELDAAQSIAKRLGVQTHEVFYVDRDAFTGSALTSDLEVPTGRSEDEMTESIPVTYVPARNTIFLAYALAYAESLEAQLIYTGMNAVDYSGYPDCRPEYVEAFNDLAKLATKRAVEGSPALIKAPLMHWSKDQIISVGLRLGVPYELTKSCYQPTSEGLACGVCDSCTLRRAGFYANGVRDPAPYVPEAPAQWTS